MGGQLVAVRVGMGIVPGRECGFCLVVVGSMGVQVVPGMGPGISLVPPRVLARWRAGVRLRLSGRRYWFMSR